MKSKKIRNSARGEDCSLRVAANCQDGETVVFAHLNSNYRGVGIKSPDLFGVYACHLCHAALDSGDVSSADQLRALQETQMKLYNKSLIEVK
tara:strand:- start:1599 stop:1874 length:276 start_codon:yes stop_codon:yes gene_type:complete